MSTIVTYHDGKPPANRYPERITSPTKPRTCCASHMEFIGKTSQDGRVTFQYKRCSRCGFTVRVILGRMVDRHLLLDLQQTFARIFRKELEQDGSLRKMANRGNL